MKILIDKLQDVVCFQKIPAEIFTVLKDRHLKKCKRLISAHQNIYGADNQDSKVQT